MAEALTKEEIREICENVPEKLKAKLEKVLSANSANRHFTDIKLFEDACDVKGVDPNVVLGLFDIIPDSLKEYRDFLIGDLQRVIICGALRGDWVPDYGNSEQKKWYCWFRWDEEGGGFVFDGSYYEYVTSHSNFGLRLCFPTEKMADYFGTQFIAIHRKVLQYKNAA